MVLALALRHAAVGRAGHSAAKVCFARVRGVSGASGSRTDTGDCR